MVPTITPTGSSFRGACAYYLHDKDAETKERVAWTHTENVATNNAEHAWKIMAYTAMHQRELKRDAGITASGRKLEKPVFAFSLAWHPEEKPDQAHMLDAAKEAVKSLGLDAHQAIYVSHDDEPHQHVHVIINRVHPEHGRAATLSKSKRKLSDWALKYEKENGKVYCRQREENAKARAERKASKYRDPVIQKAWKQSDNGKAFFAALREEGYEPAEGRKRLVIVDRWGKTHNPTRHLEGVNSRDLYRKLADVDLTKLPKAAALSKEMKGRVREDYHAQQSFDKWREKIISETWLRHVDEKGALSTKWSEKIDAKRAELHAYYRMDALQQEARHMETRLKELRQKKGFSLSRLTGAEAKANDKLNAIHRQIDDGRTRIRESLAPLEKQRDEAIELQVQQHRREEEKLREMIESRTPRPDFRQRDSQIDQGRGHERQHPALYS